MCRQNQFIGWLLMAFGTGFVIGLWIEPTFLSYCVGLGAAALGFVLLRKK